MKRKATKAAGDEELKQKNGINGKSNGHLKNGGSYMNGNCNGIANKSGHKDQVSKLCHRCVTYSIVAEKKTINR